MHRSAGSSLRAFGTRNARTIAIAIAVALLSSGTAVAASYLALSTSNTASKTTTLKSGTNDPVLQLKNINSSGGKSAAGLGITVPSGRAPITVNAAAGKATNLNADKLDGIDSTGFIKGPVEAWREVGTAGNPAFDCLPDEVGDACQWQNFGFGYNTAGFYRDPEGVVHLKGIVQGLGTFATPVCQKFSIYTLPAGYRPAATTVGLTLRGDPNEWGRIDILANGRVAVCLPQTSYTGMWFLLDGISFRAN